MTPGQQHLSPSNPADSAPSRARAVWAFFALTLFSYAYFYQGGGPNQFSRFGLTVALAERGSVRIDPHHELTFDKSFKDGHYYCDKAPGLSLLAVPFHFLCRPIIESRAEPASWAWVNLSLYLMTFFAVSLPVALAVALFYARARAEAGPVPAFWVSVALGLGSPLAVYASLFYSHALAAALLWLAFLVITSPKQPAVTPDRAALAGLLSGFAVLCEFPTVLIAGLLFLHLCLIRPRSWRGPALFVAGGVPSLILLIVYNLAAFGKPLASGYQYHYVEGFRTSMSQGIMGVTGPSLTHFVGMMFMPYRGLLWFWPFAWCVLAALLLVLLRRDFRAPVVLAVAVVGVYLLFGCSYYMWTGGASFGPRHIIPCLPFAAYLVVQGYDSILRWLAPATAIASVAVTLMSLATLAEFPEVYPGAPAENENPIRRLAFPRFLRGELGIKRIEDEGRIGWATGPVARNDPHAHDAGNAGEWLGLSGLASLLPLLAVWAGLGAYLLRPDARRPNDHGPGSPVQA